MTDEQVKEYFDTWWSSHGDGLNRELAFQAWVTAVKVAKIYYKD